MAQRTEKIAHSVARTIIADAATDRLPVGTVLEPESVMRQRYDVSRGSLREALRILELLGFLQMKTGPGGGPVLIDVGSQQFADVAALFYQRSQVTYRELVEARVMLEPMAAKMAATRRTDADIARLEEYLERATATDLTDDRRFQTVGQDFHDLVAEISGNRLLTLFVQSCYHVFADRASGYMYVSDARADVRAFRDRIARAVIDGDGEHASDLMHRHMDDYLNQATRRFEGLMDEVVKW